MSDDALYALVRYRPLAWVAIVVCLLLLWATRSDMPSF